MPRLRSRSRTPRRPRSPRAAGSLPVAAGSLAVASRPLPPPCPRPNNAALTGSNGRGKRRPLHRVPPSETAFRSVRRSTHPKSCTHPPSRASSFGKGTCRTLSKAGTTALRPPSATGGSGQIKEHGVSHPLAGVNLPDDVRAALDACATIVSPTTRAELYRLALGPQGGPTFSVEYDVDGSPLQEATVVRCKNGIAVNYPEDYMRRRDPDCMRIADDLPSDKSRFRDVYGEGFDDLRAQTLEWLSGQELVVLPFKAGGLTYGDPSLAIVPVNAAFFTLTLMDLQGWCTFEDIGPYTPRSIMYVAPPFRHTYFGGATYMIDRGVYGPMSSKVHQPCRSIRVSVKNAALTGTIASDGSP